jgi:hypothetical protein
VVADVRPYAHLTGQRHLSRLSLEGVRLRVVRDAAGDWTPPPAAKLLNRGEPGQPPAHPDELLGPLVAAEAVARFLLTRALVADEVELRDGELRIVQTGRPGAPDRWLAAKGIQARLDRQLLRGRTRLRLRGRLRDASGDRGAFHWRGTLSRAQELRLGVELVDTELGVLVPYLRDLRPAAALAGRLTGSLSLEAPSPGHGRFEANLVGRGIRSSLAAVAEGEAFESKRLALSGALAIAPDSVRVVDARLATDRFDLQLDGTVQRPLHADSVAQLALSLSDVNVAEVRHLVGWLPEIRREEAQEMLAAIETGRLGRLRTGGTATLSGWQAFLAGRTRELPLNLVVDAELADTTLRVGESDRIEGLSGRLWWSGDRIEVRGVRARLNGSALPELDLSLEGVANLFASDPAARRLRSVAEPLVGLRPLWQFLLGGREEPEGPSGATSLRLEFERLEHPMFLWPIEATSAHIEPVEGGVRVEIPSGRLAGVPLRGEAEWQFEPSEHVRAHFTTSPPLAPAPIRTAGGPWAQGRFELGSLSDGPWRQESASGRFDASGASVRFRDARVALAPSGNANATAEIDLSQPASVPFALSFAIEDGDLSTLAGSVGLPTELATGHVNLAGSISGSLEPQVPLAGGLQGLLEFEAREGTIRKAVPAVLAVALASEMINPLARKEKVRFDRAVAVFEFADGRLSSEGLAIEGPDVRAFARGGADLARPPHELDVELVLFLFRPVDQVIEKIPLLNLLLLGSNDNLVAAHFRLTGPWADPEAQLVPLQSIATGPASVVFETLPALLRRGLEALGSLISPEPLGDRSLGRMPAATPEES